MSHIEQYDFEKHKAKKVRELWGGKDHDKVTVGYFNTFLSEAEKNIKDPEDLHNKTVNIDNIIYLW